MLNAMLLLSNQLIFSTPFCGLTKKRIPLGSVSIDPRRTNIFIDSCAFDPKYAPEDIASERLFQLYEAGVINLIISHSNIKELEHPNVPVAVKREANTKIYTIKVQLTEGELVVERTNLGPVSREWTAKQDAARCRACL